MKAYVYQPYPKWVRLGGEKAIVRDEAEEKAWYAARLPEPGDEADLKAEEPKRRGRKAKQ